MLKTSLVFKIDIWALGVTLYALTYNKMPFWADSELELGNVIMKDEVDLVHQEREVSKELKQLILKLLNKDPSKRPHLSELIAGDEFLLRKDN